MWKGRFLIAQFDTSRKTHPAVGRFQQRMDSWLAIRARHDLPTGENHDATSVETTWAASSTAGQLPAAAKVQLVFLSKLIEIIRGGAFTTRQTAHDS